MTTYRFARRSFLAGLGGAFGLKILLRNLEAMAQGATSPPRFLMMHWPVGTIRYHFLPTGSNRNFSLSRILQPFEPLKADTIVLYGFGDRPRAVCGGGAEAGVVLTTTGADVPGCRENGGEGDDACAGGPSFDQIFLKNVPALQRPGAGYLNTICDERVDSYETSTRCLSYAYDTQMVATTTGAAVSEAKPLLPVLSPAIAYAKLFSGFIPGGSTDPNTLKLLRALKARKSVLDFSLAELARVRRLAPASEAFKIDAHAEAIRKAEKQISDEIGGINDRKCPVPGAPDPSLVGQSGSKNDYGMPQTPSPDDPLHERIGKAHAAIILAAFQCDIIRVATFQWSPGTNHVSFGGLYPDNPGGNYMHHPMSHRITSVGTTNGPPPPSTAGDQLSVYEFLTNVHTWYNQKTADILTDFKNAKDAFGNSVLDHTIVPFVTEIAEANSSRSPKPSLIFGGSKLGMQGGQYLNFPTIRPQTDLFVTIAQAYLGTTTPLANLSSEVFVKNGVGVIDGLWVKPP
jgi:Protein of unknown function (DUF1552)